MLIPDFNKDIPENTAEVALAAFPKGNPYLTLRDELGTIFDDEDFADLYPNKGQPTISPWRLALITIMQFRENLSDRQAADAVRSRIDWKYLLALELTDPGFDYSVLSEFRSRMLDGKSELILEKLLALCQDKGLIKARGKQRTDSTHVLAAVRIMNRLEQLGETMRAALNKIATIAPVWLQSKAPLEWYERYGKRVEVERLPKSQSKREAYAQEVGEDGFMLLEFLAEPETPSKLDDLPEIKALQSVWDRHFERTDGKVRFKTNRELGKASPGVESPYDTDARYRRRGGAIWAGYIVHVSETCEDDSPNLITNVATTSADVHEARCTKEIQQALTNKELPPGQHLVDSAYISAELLVESQQEQDITLVGPTRLDPSWQAKVDGAYDRYKFKVDWEKKQVTCPQGKHNVAWRELIDRNTGDPYNLIVFRREDCLICQARSLCTRSKGKERRLRLQDKTQYEALREARLRHDSEEGKRLYYKRAGIEGTISQGVRAFGLRKTRYRGLAKTHLQHVATAVAINLDRLVAWFNELPRAQVRTSRFAALAPS